MADLIDVLSDSGLRTGEVLSRPEVHRLGRYHRAVHLYILNSNNEVLLQRRAHTVDHYPGFFSISVVAHVNAGEYSSAAIRREVGEELGIDASPWKIDFLFSYFSEAILNGTYIDRQFNDVHVTRADVQFVPFERFRGMVLNESSGLAPVYSNECRDLVYYLGDLAAC